MTKKEFRIVLLSITLCWSSSYLFIKEIPQEFSAYAYMTLTSGVAALILSVSIRLYSGFSVYGTVCGVWGNAPVT